MMSSSERFVVRVQPIAARGAAALCVLQGVMKAEEEDAGRGEETLAEAVARRTPFPPHALRLVCRGRAVGEEETARSLCRRLYQEEEEVVGEEGVQMKQVTVFAMLRPSYNGSVPVRVRCVGDALSVGTAAGEWREEQMCATQTVLAAKRRVAREMGVREGRLDAVLRRTRWLCNGQVMRDAAFLGDYIMSRRATTKGSKALSIFVWPRVDTKSDISVRITLGALGTGKPDIRTFLQLDSTVEGLRRVLWREKHMPLPAECRFYLVNPASGVASDTPLDETRSLFDQLDGGPANLMQDGVHLVVKIPPAPQHPHQLGFAALQKKLEALVRPAPSTRPSSATAVSSTASTSASLPASTACSAAAGAYAVPSTAVVAPGSGGKKRPSRRRKTSNQYRGLRRGFLNFDLASAERGKASAKRKAQHPAKKRLTKREKDHGLDHER